MKLSFFVSAESLANHLNQCKWNYKRLNRANPLPEILTRQLRKFNSINFNDIEGSLSEFLENTEIAFDALDNAEKQYDNITELVADVYAHDIANYCTREKLAEGVVFYITKF